MMGRYPSSATGLLSAILLLGNISTLTISPGEDQAVLIAASDGYFPFLQVAVVGEASQDVPLDRLIPASKDAVPIDDHSAAYYCDRSGCHRPVTDEQILQEVLRAKS